GAECRKEWDPRHTRPTATRSSVPRNLTTHEDRTYNVAVLRSGQSELRFVQPRFQRTLPNQLFRCATDRAFYGDLASMEFLPNLSRSVESICNKSTICNCSTRKIGGSATMVVDRAPCRACSGGVRSAIELAGLDELVIIYRGSDDNPYKMVVKARPEKRRKSW